MWINTFKYITYALISTMGLYFLKISKPGINVGFISGFSLYLTSFCIWLYILKTQPISVAFPVASSIVVVATQCVGVCLLGEKLSYVKSLGILFILFGVFLVYSETYS